MKFQTNENSIPNIWTAQENSIHFYKLVSAVLGALALLLLVALVGTFYRDPIVVVRTNSEIEYYPGHRMEIPIGKPEVEKFTKEFIAALYVWSGFDAGRLKKEVSVYVEENLLEKLMVAQVQRYLKELKNKELSQAVTSIEIEVLADKVMARFDRLLKIENVPIVVPTELTLSMIQGPQTRINPMGIYISGILEHEGAE